MRRFLPPAVLCVAWCAASCGGAEDGALRVYAAASLTEALGEAAAAHAAAAGAPPPLLQFDGSARLVLQLAEGAPGDLLATADEVQMERARAAGLLAGAALPIASNRLVLAVAAGNPHGLRTLADLERAGLQVALCGPAVPAGRYARQLLDAQGVAPRLVSEEPSVRALLAKLALGELDAAIVYATDVAAAAGEFEGLPLPDGPETPRCWAAVLADARDPAAARALLDFLRGPAGQRILADHGFGAP